MGSWRGVRALLVCVAVVGGSLAVVAPAAGAAESFDDVVPSSGLFDDQQVEVYGNGWTPDDEIVFDMCADTNGGGVDFCYGGNGVFQQPGLMVNGPAGDWAGQYTVQRWVRDGSNNPYDCGAAGVRCFIQARDWTLENDGDSTTAASAQYAVSFAQTSPTVSAHPANDLVEDRMITISGNGWTPGKSLTIVERDPDSGVFEFIPVFGPAQTGPGGFFQTNVQVDRFLGDDDPYPGGEVDCLEVAPLCTVTAVWFDPDSNNFAMVGEAAGADLGFATPTIDEVKWPADLAEGSVMYVRGHGFSANSGLGIVESDPGGDPNAPSAWTVGPLQVVSGNPGTDGNGSFQFSVKAQRAPDCGESDPCNLVAFQRTKIGDGGPPFEEDEYISASTPIWFGRQLEVGAIRIEKTTVSRVSGAVTVTGTVECSRDDAQGTVLVRVEQRVGRKGVATGEATTTQPLPCWGLAFPRMEVPGSPGVCQDPFGTQFPCVEGEKLTHFQVRVAPNPAGRGFAPANAAVTMRVELGPQPWTSYDERANDQIIQTSKLVGVKTP